MRDGWILAEVGEHTSLLRRGKAPRYVETGGVAVVNQKCIRAGNYLDWAPLRRTDPVKPVPPELFVQVGDVLICSTGRGTLGRAAGVSAVPEDMTVDGHVTIVRADGDSLRGDYLGLVLSERVREFESLAGGSTNQTELSPAAIAGVKFPLPPMEEQRRIVDLVGAVDNVIEHHRRLNGLGGGGELRELRSNLLTALLSGEHEIPASYDELLEVNA